MYFEVESFLRKQNKLFSLFKYPLSSEDANKANSIYFLVKVQYSTHVIPRPLILASYLGLESLVKAFIECAKQTNTNLDTGETGEVLKFLWLTNDIGKTALDVAIEKNHIEIAKLLLKNASLECLISNRNYLGQIPVSLLSDPQHDQFIFDILEDATRKEVYPLTSSTLISIDDHPQQGSLEYREMQMSPSSYPVSHGSINELCMRNLESGIIELTLDKNTILHLLSECGDVDHVKEILRKHSFLLHHRNSQGETSAYVAAREGHVDILAIMITYLKKETDSIEPFFTRDMDKHTALHIAIQNHHVGVVFWLMHEIPQLINRVNDFNVIPHFLAAQRGFHHILQKVFSECNQQDFTTSDGKTTLHAAAIFGSADSTSIVACSSKDLLHIQDKRGWTPLLYAIYHNNSSATNALLDADCSIGYKMLKEDDITTSPIHIAARQGHYETMKVLISKCPGCLEITYGNGRNILHFAIENKKLELIKFMFSCESFTRLINKPDRDGNTPIHLLMKSDIEIGMIEVILDSRIDINALNNENHNPLDVASSEEKGEILLKGIGNVRSIANQTRVLFPKVHNHVRSGEEKLLQMSVEMHQEEELKKKDREKKIEPYFKVVANLVIVTTLIATATFAGVFAVPGGFDGNLGSNQGMPILLKKAAYKAFVVTNTIAFSCSCSVLIGYIWMLLYPMAYDESDKRKHPKKIEERTGIMYVLTGVALITMAIAFVTGLYVVLTPSMGLAISLCVMSLFIMVIMSVFPRKVLDLIFNILRVLDLIFYKLE